MSNAVLLSIVVDILEFIDEFMLFCILLLLLVLILDNMFVSILEALLLWLTLYLNN
jgi:hypothetical protein